MSAEEFCCVCGPVVWVLRSVWSLGTGRVCRLGVEEGLLSGYRRSVLCGCRGGSAFWAHGSVCCLDIEGVCCVGVKEGLLLIMAGCQDKRDIPSSSFPGILPTLPSVDPFL